MNRLRIVVFILFALCASAQNAKMPEGKLLDGRFWTGLTLDMKLGSSGITQNRPMKIT
jgi:hypothetical protein